MACRPDGPTCPRLLLDPLLMALLSFLSSCGQFWQLHVFPCHCWWCSYCVSCWCSLQLVDKHPRRCVVLLCTTSGGRAGGCSCVSNSTLLLLGLLLALVVVTVGWWWPWTFLQRGDPGSISVQEEPCGTKQPDKLEGSVWILQPGSLCKAHQ